MTKPSSSLRNLPYNKPLVTDMAGTIVPLGEEIGVGGEGRVFAVQGKPQLAAKLYHKGALPEDSANKLRAMVELGADKLSQEQQHTQKTERDQDAVDGGAHHEYRWQTCAKVAIAFVCHQHGI